MNRVWAGNGKRVLKSKYLAQVYTESTGSTAYIHTSDSKALGLYHPAIHKQHFFSKYFIISLAIFIQSLHNTR